MKVDYSGTFGWVARAVQAEGDAGKDTYGKRSRLGKTGNGQPLLCVEQCEDGMPWIAGAAAAKSEFAEYEHHNVVWDG